MPQTGILHGDKGHDSDAVRRKIESMGAAPNIPPKANRRWNCFSPTSTGIATPSNDVLPPQGFQARRHPL